MENDKLKIDIEDIKTIKMTATEKDSILKHILNSNIEPNNKNIKSPFIVYSFISLRKKNPFLLYGTMFSMFIILGGSSVVFAAQDSLPGNVLYPLKVKVIEPVTASLKTSPQARAKYESDLAIKRLNEAEDLINQDKFDTSKERELNELLSNHTNDFSKAVEKINNDDSKGEVDDIVTNFQAEMNAHAKVLDIIDNKKDENHYEDNNISKTARENARSIKFDLENRNGSGKDRYIKKNKEVRSIIDSTVLDLGNTTKDTPEIHKKIIEDTSATLDKADRFLRESEDKDKQGESKDAYSKLLDSESSAKEANIFLRTSLKFKDRSERNQNTDHRDN